MAWILDEFECPCGFSGEELVDRDCRQLTCPNCDEVLFPTMTVPRLGAYTMASTEQRAEILKQRSYAHTKKELRKEPERFGDEGIKRAREGQVQVQVKK